MANFKRNGLNAMAYRWFYGLGDYQLPSNLCPYFWKSVFMYLTIIPYAAYCIPVIIWEIFDKGYQNGDRRCGERIGLSIGLYIAAFILICLLSTVGLFFFNYTKNSFWEVTSFAGILFWALGLGIGAWELFKFLGNKAVENTHYWDEEKREYVTIKSKPTLVAEFVKAKYNKWCPRIDWE
jgi:hypothetical protein